jgi:hypothetical protein
MTSSFPLVQNRLHRFECEDLDDLLEALTEILVTLQTEELQRFFHRWIDRVRIGAREMETAYLIEQFIPPWRLAIFVQWRWGRDLFHG